MTNLSGSFFAEVGRPLFGSQPLALLAVLAGITVFLFLVAGIGRWLAATHPEAPVKTPALAAAGESVDEPLPPETLVVIAAAVTAMFGPTAQVRDVHLAHAPRPSVEALMLQWSLEGRRQIYSSHKIR
jgi:hypothetical protein